MNESQDVPLILMALAQAETFIDKGKNHEALKVVKKLGIEIDNPFFACVFAKQHFLKVGNKAAAELFSKEALKALHPQKTNLKLLKNDT